MAGRSGRRGQLPPDERRSLFQQLKQQVYDEESLSSVSLEDIPNSTLLQHGLTPLSSPNKLKAGSNYSSEGCRVCGKDDDHKSLMFCDMCDNQYHYYCLDPPLKAVPTGDWFCSACRPHPTPMQHVPVSNDNDGLDPLVCALPPRYTERFGEICWAHGGAGFGWWPACIYDPRHTVGGARELARKNLGRRHLVYFFECLMAPFSVLGEAKLVKWEKGIAEDYHLGRTALGHSKSRGNMFREALHLACLEEGKPIDMRMIWNHQGDEAHVEHIPLSPPVKRPRTKKRHRRSSKEKTTTRLPNEKRQKTSRSSRQQTSPSGTNLIHALTAARGRSSNRSSDDGQPSEMYCRVSKRHMDDSDKEVDESLGFFTLESRSTATFVDARNAIETEMDPDSLPANDWKFYLPNLGPVSHRQEQRLGPLAAFLQKTFGRRLGDGTVDEPFHIFLVAVKHHN